MKRRVYWLVLFAAALTSSADHVTKPHPKILWDVKAYPTPPDPFTIGVQAVEFSPDGEQIIAAGWDGSIKFLNRSNGAVAQTIVAHTSAVRSVSISKDGLLLASGGADRMLNLWRVSDGTLLRSINAHTTEVHSVALSPDASLVISGGGPDNQLKIWRTVDGELLRTIYGESWSFQEELQGMRSVAFAPNGEYVAGSGLEVWRLDGTVVRAGQIASNEAEARVHVKFTPDSRFVFGSVLYGIWACSVAEETGFSVQTTELSYSASALSPDGLSLISVMGLWTVMPQRPLAWFERPRQIERFECLDGECGFLCSWLAFDPRGRTVAAAAYSGEVLLFELPIWISGIQRNGSLNLRWQGGSGNYQLQKLTPPGTWEDVGEPVTVNAASVSIDSSMGLLRVRNVATDGP